MCLYEERISAFKHIIFVHHLNLFLCFITFFIKLFIYIFIHGNFGYRCLLQATFWFFYFCNIMLWRHTSVIICQIIMLNCKVFLLTCQIIFSTCQKLFNYIVYTRSVYRRILKFFKQAGNSRIWMLLFLK